MSRPSTAETGLYHLFPEYVAHAFYLELPPGVASAPESKLPEDVLAADALILTAVPEAAINSSFPRIGRGSDIANEAVRANFCVAETMGLD